MSKPDYYNATDRQLQVIIDNPYASEIHKEAAKEEVKKREQEKYSRGYPR